MAFESNTNSEELRQDIEPAPNYTAEDTDPGNFNVDIFHIFDLLHKLSIPSASDAISSIEDSLDSQGLKQYVSKDNSKTRYLECLTNLLGFCLGEHINFQLKSQGRRDIDELWHLGSFQDYCLQQVKSDQFILTEIRKDMTRNDHLFSTAWLLIADYMQDRDHAYRNTPASGPGFESRASYKTLNQWSYTLWANEGKGNPAKLDEIVKFCGRVVTIGLCPPDSTTGLQRPAPTNAVMKLFYGKVTRAIEDSYNTKRTSSTSGSPTAEPLRVPGKSIFDRTGIQDSTEPFKTSSGIPSGSGNIFTAYEQQQELYYWGMNYLPVTSSPWIGFASQPLKSSILPGSSITLSDGTLRSIEAISTGDQILTQASSNVSVSLNQRPFYKPAKAKLITRNRLCQVLRSFILQLVCDLLMQKQRSLNPYQRIGRLAVGHIVFRLQGVEYAAVGIKSIEESEESAFDRVYAISLPDEHHTYHVNGYLVDTNSPSYSLKQTVNALRKVPTSKRLGLLSGFQELWSTFQKFEIQTIYRRLNWELFGQYNSPDGEDPALGILERRISFEDLKTSTALSRPKGVPIDYLTRGFLLKAHYPDRLPAGYDLPTLSLVDGYLLVQNEAQIRSTYDPHKRCFRWTHELQQQRFFEHGVVEIHSRAMSGTGVVFLSSEPDVQNVSSRDQGVYPFEAHARSLETLHSGKQDSDDGWESYGQWNLTLDRSVWPPDTGRTEPEDPVDGGIFEDGHLESPEGVKTGMIRFPVIEQLRDQINQKFAQNLGPFYKVVATIEDGLDSYTVMFSRATLVPFVSDTGLDIKKKFGVGFQSDLGIDVTLPALYQQMTFTFDALYTSFNGHLFEYDPTKRGYKGNRHLITGTRSYSLAAEECRLKISRAYAKVYKPGVAVAAAEQLQPAPVTKDLLALKDPSIPDLVQFTGYDERSIHNDTQLLIRNMMYYHMDTDQREKILREPKPLVPEDLPTSLADNLPSKLKSFFKEKYAPAFICRYVGRTQKYATSFTDQGFKNLWYWWEGNGKNCLSQSQEYNDINRLSSREAMKKRYADKLEPYLNNNPDQWAEDLYTALINSKHLMLVWANKPIQDGNNVINKQCNILDALSPSIDRAQSFFKEFMAFALDGGMSFADIEDGNQDQEYQWIHDSMKDLIVAILNGDDWISSEVREALIQDISDFEIQNGLNQQADNNQRAAAILEKSANFYARAGWLDVAAFAGSAMFKWAGETFDNLAAKYASKLPGVDKLKGLASASMACVSLVSGMVSLWGLVDSWDTMSDAAKATVIIEVMGMVLDAADKALDAWKSFKSQPASTAADEIIWNEKLGNVAQEIAGEEDFRVVIGDGIQADGVPVGSEPAERWNEDINSIAKDVPPGYEDAARKFNISGNLLRILNIILGIGLVVAMSFSLVND
ncbi:hypothetical protein AJ79_03443 [Helicocarpus griseus UAMH5409]|uniref:Uncharacterized protein n=1 Tax=Helicocarpus griseus UAMH5409 TaxID=1447875 RepID=A0A2B7XPN9_9EURO|nr:hypothetical protein AJ79_03443 [Helicocarpus griseus UAMH5409]